MSQTANFKLPKPALTDQPNGPVQIAALADAVDGVLAGWFAPRMKRVQRTGAGVAIPDSSSTSNWTTLTGFAATTVQIGANITYGSGIYTVDFTGAVEVSLYVVWPAISAAHRTLLRILQNGAQADDGLNTVWYPAGTTGQTGQKVISQFPVAAGDQISQQVWQDSGASVTTATDGAVFTIRRIA